jgi:hypothetical protein
MAASNIGNWHGSNVQSAINSAHLTEEGGHRSVFNSGTFQMQLMCRSVVSPRTAVEMRVVKERLREESFFIEGALNLINGSPWLLFTFQVGLYSQSRFQSTDRRISP